MFKVENTILSDACCVIGDAGATVGKDEIPVVYKAYARLKDKLQPNAAKHEEKHGIINSGEKHAGGEI